MERERDVEKYLRRNLGSLGCLFLKWVSPGEDGVPDRILIMPGGKICFVEVKTDTGHMTGLQMMWQRKLRKMGCSAVTVYGMTGAKELIEVVKAMLKVKEVMPDDVHPARVPGQGDREGDQPG